MAPPSAALLSRLALLGLLALAAVPARAQWAFGFGGPDRDAASAVALAADGGVFLTGTFSGTADFDPDPLASAELSSAGGQDVFLARYTAEGALAWAARLGGPNWEDATGLAVDAEGNVYVTGSFEGAADFDPDPEATYELTGAGFGEAFVASYTAEGALRWAFSFGGGDYDEAVAIAASADGVYVTGAFEGTADFDPGAGTFELTGSEFGDVFVARYSFDGEFVWAFNVGIFAHDDGAGIATDAEGNVFVTGSFSGIPVDFDPGEGVAFPAYEGKNDAFVASYTADGAFRWVAALGGESYDAGEAVAVDAAGNVYAVGFFNGIATLDPGPVTLTADGPQDVFVVSYTNEGAYRWAFRVGGAAWDNAHALAVVDGSVFVTGAFGESVDFDPGAGEAVLAAFALDDIYVAHYTTGGAYVEAFNVGGGLGNFGLGVAATAGGEVWVAGAFEGTADFDPGAGALVLTALDRDGFLARYEMALVVGAEPGAAPAAGALSAAYPNPLRDAARLTLTLERPEAVTVGVYDALGRRVATLHEGALPAGPTALTLDAARLPAGSYVVKAAGETFTAARRVTVVR